MACTRNASHKTCDDPSLTAVATLRQRMPAPLSILVLCFLLLLQSTLLAKPGGIVWRGKAVTVWDHTAPAVTPSAPRASSCRLHSCVPVLGSRAARALGSRTHVVDDDTIMDEFS
jgi:hypothetical protein